MAEPQCLDSGFTVGDGAASGRKTSGASPKLIEGDVIRQVCIELPTNSAPCHVVIHVIVGGRPVELKAGWVRGPSDHGGAGALIWDAGRFPVPEQSEFFIFARNDTGGSLDFSMHWVVERASPRVKT